jgi:uncharacterized repeat protein (TIGR03943 family)
MTRMARATVMLLLGTFCGRLVLTGSFSMFVQRHMRIPLAVASLVMFVFGVVELFGAYREMGRDEDSSTLPRAPSVGALLIMPLLVLTAVVPTGLGATAAGRVASLMPAQSTRQFEPIPEVDDLGRVPTLRHSDFLTRALWDRKHSLQGKRVRLVGIVVHDPLVPDGFMLTRFMVSCCAADGIPMKVALRGVAVPFVDDQWVEAVGVWRAPSTPDGRYNMHVVPVLVEMDAVSVQALANPPSSPYESPY